METTKEQSQETNKSLASPSFESGQFNLSISENGLKTLTEEKILYTSKFQRIQWTCDPDYELPIKMA